jgi:uncharacterized hydrophobic protein (TIGR00271 family)
LRDNKSQSNTTTMNTFLRQFIRYTNLEGEVDDFNLIHENIQKDVIFKGTNLWILIFAILVASVGLNMNSTAVIIGAMLISPLMGPINGIGYSIATYDFPLFQKAIKNFSFAVLASLAASTAYFAISPVSTAHSELLARTSPTIYDVLIALFGGFAGIVAISSRQKGNVIPGVAIATALMPPLCTAGYGLATGQFSYFFGAFYLFTINTVFIAIASMVVSQVLKFPIRTIVDKSQRKRVNQYISLVIVITIVPSIYFGYLLVQKEKFIENAGLYVNNISVFEGNFLLKHAIDGDKKRIELIYGGNTLSEEQKQTILQKAVDFKLVEASIDVRQGIAIDGTDRRVETDQLKEEIKRLKTQIESYEKESEVHSRLAEEGTQLHKELNALFSWVEGCGIARANWHSNQNEADTSMLIVLEVRNDVKLSEKTQVETWLRTKYSDRSVRIVWDK